MKVHDSRIFSVETEHYYHLVWNRCILDDGGPWKNEHAKQTTFLGQRFLCNGLFSGSNTSITCSQLTFKDNQLVIKMVECTKCTIENLS